MADRYAVFGNPIAHSKSPRIHTLFAEQTGEAVVYEARLAEIGQFAAAVAQFRSEGGRGCNVTVPFKLEAAALASHRSERVLLAGAANTLSFSSGAIVADNTEVRPAA